MSRNPLTLDEAKAIVAEVKFLDRDFLVMEKGDGFLIQLAYWESDVYTGERSYQKARKWYVSSWSTRSEIVRTCFKAVMTSMEHVVREHFLYKGERIFNPHWDVDVVARMVHEAADDVRVDDREKK